MYFLSYLICMSCKLLTHPSISTYIWAINLVLTGPCRLSAIPSITIYSIAVITWIFAVSLCPTALTFSIIFLLWFSVEVIGVLKWLGHLVQAFSPQTRDDWAVEQSLWQISWEMNHFCTCYVSRTDIWSNLTLTVLLPIVQRGIQL